MSGRGCIFKVVRLGFIENDNWEKIFERNGKQGVYLEADGSSPNLSPKRRCKGTNAAIYKTVIFKYRRLIWLMKNEQEGRVGNGLRGLQVGSE